MGAEVLKLAGEGYRGAEVVAGVDPAGSAEIGIPCAKSFADACAKVDVIVDFSHHAGTADLVGFATDNCLPWSSLPRDRQKRSTR